MNHQKNQNPPSWWKSTVPSMLRRAPWHDYYSRCFYMISINKRRGIPRFSNVIGSLTDPGDPPRCELNHIGKLIYKQWRLLEDKYPQVEVSCKMIMPDHVHFILFMKEHSDKHLGTIIGSFKGLCTSALGLQEPVFDEGFHDRIVHGANLLPKLRYYICDNPRRYLIRKLHPDYFDRRGKIRIDGQELVNESAGWVDKDIYLEYYGNFLLLKKPEKLNVRISRSVQPGFLQYQNAEVMKILKNGGVLISPWISPPEKEIFKLAIEKGGNVIRIVNNGFHERWKPQGLDFELCSQGRMAIIACSPYSTISHPLSKNESEFMNHIARLLA